MNLHVDFGRAVADSLFFILLFDLLEHRVILVADLEQGRLVLVVVKDLLGNLSGLVSQSHHLICIEEWLSIANFTIELGSRQGHSEHQLEHQIEDNGRHETSHDESEALVS